MQPASLTRLLPVAIVAVGGFLVELSLWEGRTDLRWGFSTTPGLLVLLCAGGVVGPVLTRVKPIPGFLLTVATALALSLAVPAWEPFTGVLIALFLLARMETTVVAAAGLGLAALPLAAITWNSAAWTGPVTVSTFLPVLLLWLLVAVAVWGAGRAVKRSRERIVTLEQSLSEAERNARAAERRVIARDLHDIVAHSVAAIQLQAGGAHAVLEAGRQEPGSAGARASAALENIEDLSHQAMRELHRLLVTMRTEDAVATAPGHSSPNGLKDLDGLLTSTRESGVDVELHETGERGVLDPSIELAAYRCLQECLTNAMKHAGAGSRMVITIVWGSDLVVDALSIGAPGATVPTRTIAGGLGLVGLSERLASVGGTLEAEASPRGFRTTVRIPLGE